MVIKKPIPVQSKCIRAQLNSMVDHQKSNAIDYVKSIGIIFVLFAHYPNNITAILQIYTFHMPLFFFLGGLLFNSNKSALSFYKNIFQKYFMYIVISYILLALSVNFLHYFFGTQKITTHLGSISDTISLIVTWNFHNNPLFMVGWFLFSYMILLMIAFPIYFLINKIDSEFISSFISLIVGLIFGYVAINYISPEYKTSKIFYLNILCQIMVGLMFFMCGYSSKKVIWKILNPYLAFLLILLVTSSRENGLIYTLSMSWSTYNDGFVNSAIGAFAGIYVTFFLADLFSKAGNYSLISRIGVNSKSIMTFHMLCFTIMDILLSYVGLFHIDSNRILTHFKSPYSFIIYMLMAIFMSIVIGDALSKLSKKLYS